MRGQVRFSRSRNRTPFARRASGPRDLLALLRPAGAFAYPRQVVQDPDLTLNEKRAILASWASDACSKDAPALRQPPRDGASSRSDLTTSWKRCASSTTRRRTTTTRDLITVACCGACARAANSELANTVRFSTRPYPLRGGLPANRHISMNDRVRVV